MQICSANRAMLREFTSCRLNPTLTPLLVLNNVSHLVSVTHTPSASHTRLHWRIHNIEEGGQGGVEYG